jgi:hypothetical protein
MFQYPDLHTLTSGLTSELNKSLPGSGRVTILDRTVNAEYTTFPSERVLVRLADGRELRLLCKYAANYSNSAYHHRGGIEYEAAVYRHIIQASRLSKPTFYGAYTAANDGDTWLIIQFVDGGERVNRSPDPRALILAARWIGQFHAETAQQINNTALNLHRYHNDYYAGWLQRMMMFSKPLHSRFPWLGTLFKRADRFIALLLDAPLTIIHGEYYPKNVLFHEGSIYPVDWESAAVAAGEIDLAALVEGWPAQQVRACEIVYRQARWPNGPPPEFTWALEMARLYLHCRWLGDRAEWTTDAESLWRFDALYSISQQLGIL